MCICCNYSCLGFATFGSFGKMLVDFSIIVSQVGTLEPYSLGIDDLLSLSLSGFNCAYLIFISENIYSIFPHIPKLVYLMLICHYLLLPYCPLLLPRMIYVVLLLMPLGFLCNLRHLGTLAPFRLVVALFVIMNSPPFFFLPSLPSLLVYLLISLMSLLTVLYFILT